MILSKSKKALTMRLVVFAIVIASALVTFPGLSEGSVIQAHLATAAEVTVVVGAAGLSYDPVPGFDRSRFEIEVANSISKELEECGVLAVGSSTGHLLFTFRKVRKNDLDHVLGLRVTAELREPANLLRVGADGRQSEVVVTSWRAQSMRLSAPDRALAKLIEAARWLAEDFAGTVAQARLAAGLTSAESERLRGCFD